MTENIEFVRLVVEFLVAPFAIVLFWMLRRLIADVKSLEKQMVDDRAAADKALADYKLHVAEVYTTKNDLEKAITSFEKSNEAILRQLERMDTKLDSKADRVTA